jgi:Tol biopolymer transport system component
MNSLGAIARSLSIGALIVGLVGCEPVDTGGGGGVANNGHLAFIRESRLTTAAEDGTALHIITETGTTSSDPALSPNGQSIAFAYSETGNTAAQSIYVVPTGAAAGTGLQLVAQAVAPETFSSPSWDPTGSTIYFLATQSGASRILKADSAGVASSTAVATNIVNAQSVTVVDANTLLVSLAPNGDLNTLDLTANSLTPLNVTGVTRPTVSHEGAQFAYANAAGQITVQGLAAGSVSKVITAAGVAADARLAFSPDSTLLAFGTSSAMTLFTRAAMPSWGL